MEFRNIIDDTFDKIDGVLKRKETKLALQQVGIIISAGSSIARIKGLPEVHSEELIRFPDNKLGIAFNLDGEGVDCYLLDEASGIRAGQEVHLTGRVMDVPVGEELLGRIIDPIGRPLDDKEALTALEKRSIEREAPGIMMRAPVNVPLQTGIQAIDALIPVGRGQRELILGDRQTGKTAIALDTIINQTEKNVMCIYCAIGQSGSNVARVAADLTEHGAMENTILVAATGASTPGLNFIAPYAATTIGEYFMEKGRDVLIVYDDLTHHARSYRELSLLLRRPPAREAYPGDIFYIHSRLLERSTHLRKEHGGGSLTALPIIETEAENMSAYIPTNLISITDGQIYLSPKLFREGILPAIDIGKSVSRVGGKTQLPSYRAVAGDLRLSYSQFEELETFARFGVQLDEETSTTLERGRRVREVLKQKPYDPIPVPEQIAVLLSVTRGLFDDIKIEKISEAKELVRKSIRESADISKRIIEGEKLSDEDRTAIIEKAKDALKSASGLRIQEKKAEDKEHKETENKKKQNAESKVAEKNGTARDAKTQD